MNIIDFLHDNQSATIAILLELIGNPAFLPLVGTRLLVNIKEAAAKGLHQGTSCILRTSVSRIDFAVPRGTAAQRTEDGTTEILEIGEAF